MSICIVLYVCDIYVLYCVCSFFFFFFFFLFFCLMIGKTIVMFGYANKEFEFEFVLIHRRDSKDCTHAYVCSECVSNANVLTHWGRVTHICVGNLIIIGWDNGSSPGWRQAIIWTNAGILLIGPLGTSFREILNGIQTFSFKIMHLKKSSAKWRPFVSASMG